jgi:two-component system, OmpR family, phosphate regulon response regulator PhoB
LRTIDAARAVELEENAASEPRVLVVDDEMSLRFLCQVNLEAAGFDVREAVDGEEALQLIGEEAPDLVLLDVMMPRQDGWSVAAELGRDARTRQLPIVFLTARAEAADRERAYELGAVGYIVKPFDPLLLGDTITRIIDRIGRGEREQLRRAVWEGLPN